MLICVYDVATSVTCNTCADTRESHQHARHTHTQACTFVSYADTGGYLGGDGAVDR